MLIEFPPRPTMATFLEIAIRLPLRTVVMCINSSPFLRTWNVSRAVQPVS